MSTRPDLGFERLLSAIANDLINISDEEILTIANELGLKPGMQGSVALFGVTSLVRRKKYHEQSALQTRKPSVAATTRGRRRPKGDIPSST